MFNNMHNFKVLFYFIQVSYTSGSPKFENKLKYPNTYRAAPSSTSFSKAKAAIIKYYGWKRVAILHQYDPEFFSPVQYYPCTYFFCVTQFTYILSPSHCLSHNLSRFSLWMKFYSVTIPRNVLQKASLFFGTLILFGIFLEFLCRG